MHKIKPEYLNKFADFIGQLQKKDKVGLLYDKDGDGISAAAIVHRSIERIRGKGVNNSWYVKKRSDAIDDDYIAQLKRYNITWLIIVDINADEHKEQIKKIEKFARVIIFDHHTFDNDVTSKKTLLLKPQLFCSDPAVDPAQYCTAKMVYDFFAHVVDITDIDWISAIGTISDFTFQTWSDFLSHVFKKYKMRKKKDMFETHIGKVGTLIFYAQSEDAKNAKKALEILKTAQRLEDVEEGLAEFQRVADEVEYYYKNYKKIGEMIDDNFFMYIEPKAKIGSIVSSKVSHKKLPSTSVFVFVEGTNGMVGVNARRQDYKVPMNKVLKAISSKLPDASGGGHIPAAGGTIRKADIPRFKELVVQETKRLRQKT